MENHRLRGKRLGTKEPCWQVYCERSRTMTQIYGKRKASIRDEHAEVRRA